MLVPVLAVVLMVAGLVVGVVGFLAALSRLPRNRVIGVRTGWTMARIDAFRRANRVAAPAFTAAGLVGLVAAAGALVAPVPTARVTLVVLGGVGLLVLLGVGGSVGARYAEADRVQTLEAESRPVRPCTADDGDVPDRSPDHAPDDTATADAGSPCAPAGCAGSCAICPKATVNP